MTSEQRRRWFRARYFWLLLMSVAIATVAKAWYDTSRDPIVHRLSITSPVLPHNMAAVRILLMSDIHVAGPDMPPSRLKRIVEQANALSPDIVVIAGDFVSDKRTATHHYSSKDAIDPLAALKPAIATVAVPGNHDHWRDMDSIEALLAKNGIILLANAARQIGPVALAGIDDDFTGRADIAATLAATETLSGPRILLSHSPDPFPDVPENWGLMLAGHTHCGQLRYPWGGAPATMSAYGDKYACGLKRENGNILVTSAGLGTSVLPFRLFSQPDMWLIEIHRAGVAR